MDSFEEESPYKKIEFEAETAVEQENIIYYAKMPKSEFITKIVFIWYNGLLLLLFVGLFLYDLIMKLYEII